MVVGCTVAQLPVAAEGLEVFIELQELRVSRGQAFTESRSAGVCIEKRRMRLMPGGCELPQRPRLTELGDALPLHRFEVHDEHRLVETGEARKVVDLGKALDTKCVVHAEARF